MWWQVWWVWIAAGLAVACIEVVVPGYVFLGFAIGAVLTGVLLGLGVLTAGSFAVLASVFAGLSLVAWAGLILGLGRRKGQVKIWDRDINDNR